MISLVEIYHLNGLLSRLFNIIPVLFKFQFDLLFLFLFHVNEIISRLNDIFQPMRCRNYVEQTTCIFFNSYSFSSLKFYFNLIVYISFLIFIIISFLVYERKKTFLPGCSMYEKPVAYHYFSLN